MKRFSLPLIAALLFLINGFAAARDQVTKDVLTYHNDIYRTGVYAGETILRPATISSKRFGKIFARQVLGQIWGQPLYVRGVPVKGQLRNVVYVATSENWVYGFDADDRRADEQTSPLMNASLGIPDRIFHDDPKNFYTIYPSNGISSTPVIDLGNPPDPRNGTLYVVAKLDQDKKFHVFALDLPTLSVQKDVIVTGKVGQINFDSEDHLNRPALLITKNQLIIAFGSGPQGDSQKVFHGWVMSYSLPDLVQPRAFVTMTTRSQGGSIWQSGAGPAADDEGNVYFMTGNGRFRDAPNDPPLQPDLADSFVKLATNNGLHLVDWYAPPSREVLQVCDLDLGASGPAVIQESGKVLGAGKSGILYLLDKENMGKTPPVLDRPDKWRGDPDCGTSGQCFRVAENQFQPSGKSKRACPMVDQRGDLGLTGGDNGPWHLVVPSYPHVHGSPVVWKLGDRSFNLYILPEEDFLKAYHFDGQKFSPNPVGSSAPLGAAMMSMPGGLLSLSWDGTNANTGIIWASRPDPYTQHNVGNPFVSVFHDQQHFVVRNKSGAIWDSFYVRGQNRWRFHEINTNGHPAASDVFVSVFGSADQQHFVYTDSLGNVWDSLFRRGVDGDGTWRYQRIDTHGHTPAGRIFVSAFFDQQHFVFRDGAGRIWDSFYAQKDNKWHCQQITTGWLPPKPGNCQQIKTGAHPAAGNVFVSDFGAVPLVLDPVAAQQQHFVYTDQFRNIWDAYYARRNDTWRYQQIPTYGHTPVGEISVANFFDPQRGVDQQHFAFRDGAGRIWDSFYAQKDNKWHCQQITTGWLPPKPGNCQQIKTGAHPAAGNVFVSVFGAANQQHFVYTDQFQNIWDAQYRRNNNSWVYQQVPTYGHTPVGRIFVSDFFDQQHFVFRDSAGRTWHSFYAQKDNKWHFHQIQPCMDEADPDHDHANLAPDDAQCNAINKIIHGYLQAFDATPGRNGQLKELWNSGGNPGDRVKWFAKNSPPTIADGKVFVAEFPAPVINGIMVHDQNIPWNTSTAFGRLIVYSLR